MSMTPVACVAGELAVELRPALGLDLTLQSAADVEIGARAQFLRDEVAARARMPSLM
jgi:hypothetical protein